MIIPAYPDTFPRSDEIHVAVNGQEVEVLKTRVAYFVSFSSSEELQVEVTGTKKIGPLTISPQRLGITAEVEENRAHFHVKNAQLLHIIIEGVELPLFFYANPERSYDGKATYYFPGGQIHEAGEIVLHDHESIYIEEGAVVRGSIRASHASHIKIYGNGILDASCFHGKSDYRTILLYRCSNVEIQDIIMIEPPLWMITLAACDTVHIDRIKQIGEVTSSDGVDIVGSHDVLIENCIMRNNDDCIVIKGFNWTNAITGEYYRAAEDVYNVLVRSCTLMNGEGGIALEIGHELTINSVSNIVFSDIDIVAIHGHGAPFGIHVGDRALVSNVRFEHIRVQHYYEKLIDFRVMRSRYNIDKERGHIKDIVLKDIRVTVSSYNPGYSISVIGGYDSSHQVQGVILEDFYLGDLKVTNSDQLDLFTREAEGIEFR